MVKEQQFEGMQAYWRKLQDDAGGAIPKRRQFNPMKMPQLLPYFFMFERKAEDVMEVRVVGTGIELVTGRSLTGKNYIDYVAPEERELFIRLTNAICLQPCGGILNRDVPMSDGKHIAMNSINFPMADEDGNVRYVLGVLTVKRTVGSATRGFVPTVGFSVRSVSLIDLGFGVPDATPFEDAIKAAGK